MAYCPQCGANVENAAYCPQCGAVVNAENNPFAAGVQTSDSCAAPGAEGEPIPSFGQAFKVCWKKGLTLEGRASRSEYWFFALWNALISLPAAIAWIYILVQANAEEMTDEVIDGAIESNPVCIAILLFYGLYAFAAIAPNICVAVRRLHDIGRHGAWWFISWVPYVGGLIFFIFTCLKSNIGVNAYGPQPKPRG